MEKTNILKKRLPYIDLLECIAIFLVIAYHGRIYSYDFLAESKVTYYLVYLFRTISAISVPIFFFANGYLLFNKKFEFKKHIVKILRIIILTGAWGVINLVLQQIIRNEYFTLKEFLYALWSQKQGWINILWYMGALVCIYIFFPLLKYVYDTNKKLFVYFIAISAVLTLGNSFLNQAGTVFLNLVIGKSKVLQSWNFFNMFNPYQGLFFGYGFVYFCTGGLMHSLKDRIESIPVKRRNIVSVLGIVLSCLCLWGVGICYSISSGEVWDVVWYGFDSVFTFFNVIFIFTLCLNWKCDNRLVRIVSSNTLGIYFMHMILVDFIRPMLKDIELLRYIPIYLIYVFVILLLCLAVCLILRKIPLISNLVK